MTQPLFLTSRSNPLLKRVRQLIADNTAYRSSGEYWIEGEHLCSAALAQQLIPKIGIFSEQAWSSTLPDLPSLPDTYRSTPAQCVVVPDALFRELSGLESPAPFGFVMALPTPPPVRDHTPTVVLDRVQDAGNVGSILRSAAAFGFTQIVAIKGSAALWSTKVLRAGMGAHFALDLTEGVDPATLATWQMPIAVTSSHAGSFIQDINLPNPCAWVMGHEGQGVSQSLLHRATHHIRIGQPGGQESLNVAAAAAICLHASSVGKR